MYRCKNGTIKKAEHQRIDAFELWHWRRLLRVPWTARRSSQSILKEISPKYLLEGLMLKLKLQYFGHLMQKPTHWRRPWCWERLKAGGEGDEIVGWHHWLNGHEFEQGLGVGDGQGSLACCDPWGCKEWDTTERLNWTESFASPDAEKPLFSYHKWVKLWMGCSSYPTGKRQGLMKQCVDWIHSITAPRRMVRNPSGDAVTNCFLDNSSLQRRSNLISLVVLE